LFAIQLLQNMATTGHSEITKTSFFFPSTLYYTSILITAQYSDITLSGNCR